MTIQQLFLTAVIASCFVHQISCKTCPVGFVNHGKSCYWFSTVKASFYEARSMCRYFDSHLVQITSKWEDNFIRGYAMLTGSASRYLLGATDLRMEGKWTWEGEETPMMYTNWYPGQPSNAGGVEHCLDIARDYHRYKWNDDRCDSSLNFICERPADKN